MTKSELIARLAMRFPQLVAKDADFAVKEILDAMTEALAHGDRIEIRGFGSFSVRTRKPRTTKNPKTGKMMNIPARKTLHFTMSKSLKEVLIDEVEYLFFLSSCETEPAAGSVFFISRI